MRRAMTAPPAMPPELFARYNDLLLGLYRAGRRSSQDAFQQQAFEMIKTLIPFDSGWWALGVSEAPPRGQPYAGPKIFDVYFHVISPKMLKMYNQFKHLDTYSRALARQPGVTLSIETHKWYSKFIWPYLDFFGLQQVMSTNLVHPRTGLTTGITFCRKDRNNPFTEQDRLIKQALMPHLVDAYSRNQIDPWVSSIAPEASYPLAAIAGREGGLHHAADGFDTMLAREWPDWRGPVLPGPLKDILASGEDGKFSGAKIAASISQREHLALVQLRPLSLLDQLSDRQLKIAHFTAEGMNHKEIARRMELAPKTVRNYQALVYQKLGVNNKIALMEMLRAAR